mmetsp:Transcript_18466/g.35306  ORF Transcript_18466/g.35306 Transcript_18466/m.35306 type:complete len:95 (+) Transcript_18466:800-1084(+)
MMMVFVCACAREMHASKQSAHPHTAVMFRYLFFFCFFMLPCLDPTCPHGGLATEEESRIETKLLKSALDTYQPPHTPSSHHSRSQTRTVSTDIR